MSSFAWWERGSLTSSLHRGSQHLLLSSRITSPRTPASPSVTTVVLDVDASTGKTLDCNRDLLFSPKTAKIIFLSVKKSVS